MWLKVVIHINLFDFSVLCYPHLTPSLPDHQYKDVETQ